MGIFEILKASAKGLLKEDDAAKKIAELGYPESVAKRIASGKLPMDEASRAARRDAFGEKMYRGLGQAYEEGAGTNQTTWATPNPDFASGYAIENAEKLLDPAANVIPVRVKSENPLDLGFRTSFTEVKPDDIAQRVSSRVQEDFASGKISRDEAIKADDAIWDWYESLHDLDKKAFRPVFSYWNKDAGFVEALKKAGYDSIKDAEVSSGSWGSFNDTPDVKTLGVLDDSNRRSEFAAFDPEYEGSNILGFQGGKPDIGGGLMSAVSSGAGYMPSDDTDYGEDAVSGPNWDDIKNVPEEVWQNMNALEKAALLTSVVPGLGAATGVVSDLYNMYDKPEERTLANALLLAANFVPGKKIAEGAEGIMGAVKDIAKNKPKIDWKGQSKKFTTDVFRNESVSMPKDINKFADKMTDAKAFNDAPTIEVNANDIIPTQKFISKSNMDKLPSPNADTGAELVKVGDKYYVVDGHHRIANNLFAGADSVKAKVIEFK